MEAARTPIAVLISDIHFTPATLEIATSALKQAQQEAARLKVPLILAGDTLDTKAVVRAECANRLIELFDRPVVNTHVLVGNHDLLNEKSGEHSLNFLKPYVDVIDVPSAITLSGVSVEMIPYLSNRDRLLACLNESRRTRYAKLLIMHQGVQTAYMGHYVQDKTSLPPEAFDGLRVISGHYHRAQDIKCGKRGLFSYIGNPYTLSFGEANDGPKGFRVLYDDGTLELVPTNLRKHVIYEVKDRKVNNLTHNAGDLVWIKWYGTTSELARLKRADLEEGYVTWDCSLKLDLIPTDSAPVKIDTNKLTRAQILDTLIDSSGETESQRLVLKKLWREIV